VGSAGEERPWWRFPGAEAATEEAAAAVIMTCFVVGCHRIFFLVWWGAGCVLVNKPGVPAEIT